jgi:predicted oxidoreductase
LGFLCHQIHWPLQMKKGVGFSVENVIPATWAAMEKLFHVSKARAIGIRNFSSKKLADLLAIARMPPTVNQVECHPVWQQDKIRALDTATRRSDLAAPSSEQANDSWWRSSLLCAGRVLSDLNLAAQFLTTVWRRVEASCDLNFTVSNWYTFFCLL